MGEAVTQARERAHLRPVRQPRCHCGKPATHELFNGVNAQIGRYCGRCGEAALAAFKRGER